ncbi:LysM peptidoglycan-binding domain-containing protein [Paenibacillus humicola]|uniref:LysM peptidoglycan-binding domain-containing protein n=1 Tax=Paenibacillus humicola TaxID=3110540 RepID=UPI00237BD834|nr:LysM peptidoglycan-binding domain-containing protein [Paenibacillus humicola]
MHNQSNGLRFDVYERVHLPDTLAAIDELDEIELVPRIQIVHQGQQVILKGHLLLSGAYRAQNESEAAQALEHRIPVEITLPLNRVNRLDDIAVEIDNFDVDLLSARTLNVTGVLSLYGLELEQPSEQESWRHEEPFTVVHARDAEEGGGQTGRQESTPGFGGWAAPPTQTFREAAQREADAREAAEREAAARHEAEAQEAAQREAEAQEFARREAEAQEFARREAEAQEAARREAEAQEAAQREAEAQEAARREAEELEDARREAEAWAAYRREQEQEAFQAAQAGQAEGPRELESDQWELAYSDDGPQQDDASFAAEPGFPSGSQQDFSFESERQPFGTAEPESQAQPEFGAAQPFGDVTAAEADSGKKEMRVALGSKPLQDAEPAGGIGFRSLLQSSLREQEARAAAEQSAQAEAEAEAEKQAIAEEIELKNLFLGSAFEDRSFRKVRLCIVQRDETLETIAGRYQLQPREIALYNRLSDQNVSEGQVLYIP